MAEEIVDITGLDRGAVLAALYNNTHAPGLGVLHYSVAGMSVEEATELLEERWDVGIEAYFDYLHGRVMKIAIPHKRIRSILKTWGYDRDNGEGAVAKIIADLRATGEVNSAETQTAHRKNQASANEDTLEATKIPTVSEQAGTHTRVLKLGIDELAPQVRAALVKAEEALIKADEDNN